jgi:hypothetical protein
VVGSAGEPVRIGNSTVIGVGHFDVRQAQLRSEIMVMFKSCLIATMLAVGGTCGVTAATSESRQCEICGTWILVDRIDRAANGDVIPESTLGQDPVGILVYDRVGNVAVQLMKRNRAATAGTAASEVPGSSNNTGSGNGYDAYFGKYRIDSRKHTVTHMLEGGISPADIGKSVTRTFQIVGDELRLSFETQNGGVAVRRTLRWRRVA